MNNKTKRMVTDPRTGERTTMTTTNKNGRVEWYVSKDWQEDVIRAKEKTQRKEKNLNIFRRAISV